MSTLLAGPWLGEFGWEVMTWIPALRKRSRRYDSTVVVCREGHDYLYQDFATKIIHQDKRGLPDRWLYAGERVKMPSVISELFHQADVITPRSSVCTEWEREYIKYGLKHDDYAYDLVIHARAHKKYGQEKWNWRKVNYGKLVKKLGVEKVCCIGTVAHYVKGTEDLRGISIGKLCNILASSKVFFSPSSGPGHLASLCGCSHVIMTDSKWRKAVGGTNRDRYKRIWNPFKTRCTVLDHHRWKPPVAVVVKALERYLK